MGKDPHRDAFKTAAAPTLVRIRRDRAQAPRALKRVFTVIACGLFHPLLTATKAWKDSGIKDRALMAAFRDFTERTLADYITESRIEVAHVLMLTTDFRLTAISLRVGYDYHPTFIERYRGLKGKAPFEVARPLAATPSIPDETSLGAGRGLLDEHQMVEYVKDLRRIYPAIRRRIRVVAADAAGEPEPRILVDGAGSDRLQAEGLWQEIRHLPFEEQRRRVRRYLFASTALFDLLRETSRQEGRRSRRRGIEVAELALVSLEGGDGVFGEKIHDLRALGWAWLGNAHGLALDLSAGKAAFEHADREWSEPRARRDLLVLANVRNLRGSLRMMRREYAAATRDLDRSCSLFRQSGDWRGEALALIQRAAIHGYADKLDKAVRDLREALGLIDERDERELAFAARGNLANALARAGETESAAEELARARELNDTIDNPLGTPEVEWIDGFISERRGDHQAAKRLYLNALAGFRDAQELSCFAQVAVDLMAIHSIHDDWESVVALAAEAMPILASQRLHSETLAAVKLLAQAVEAESLSQRVLQQLRDALLQDPLTSL